MVDELNISLEIREWSHRLGLWLCLKTCLGLKAIGFFLMWWSENKPYLCFVTKFLCLQFLVIIRVHSCVDKELKMTFDVALLENKRSLPRHNYVRPYCKYFLVKACPFGTKGVPSFYPASFLKTSFNFDKNLQWLRKRRMSKSRCV